MRQSSLSPVPCRRVGSALCADGLLRKARARVRCVRWSSPICGPVLALRRPRQTGHMYPGRRTHSTGACSRRTTLSEVGMNRLVLHHLYAHSAFDLSNNRNHGIPLDVSIAPAPNVPSFAFDSGDSQIRVEPSPTLADLGSVRAVITFNLDPGGPLARRYNLMSEDQLRLAARAPGHFAPHLRQKGPAGLATLIWRCSAGRRLSHTHGRVGTPRTRTMREGAVRRFRGRPVCIGGYMHEQLSADAGSIATMTGGAS